MTAISSSDSIGSVLRITAAVTSVSRSLVLASRVYVGLERVA